MTFDLAAEGPWYRFFIGYGNFHPTFKILADQFEYEIPDSGFHQAHNTLLQAFLETGLVGVVLLILPWWVVFSILIRTWTAGPAELSSLAGCLMTLLVTVAAASQMDLTLARQPGEIAYYLLGTAFAIGAMEDQPDGRPVRTGRAALEGSENRKEIRPRSRTTR